MSANTSVLLATIDENGNVISNNVTATNKTDITGLQTKTGASYGLVNLTRPANDYSKPNLAFIKAGNCVRQIGYLNTSNSLGFYYSNHNSSSGASPVITFAIDGKLGIGNPTPTEALDVNGNVKCTYFKTSSDYRLKQNIQPLKSDYDITTLNPYLIIWEVVNQ